MGWLKVSEMSLINQPGGKRETNSYNTPFSHFQESQRGVSWCRMPKELFEKLISVVIVSICLKIWESLSSKGPRGTCLAFQSLLYFN